MEEGRPSASHDGLDESWGCAEGRNHLGRFQDAKSPAGSRPNEDEATALANGLGHQVGSHSDASLFTIHRRDDLSVLAKHQLNDLICRGVVHGEAVRVDGLCENGGVKLDHRAAV